MYENFDYQKAKELKETETLLLAKINYYELEIKRAKRLYSEIQFELGNEQLKLNYNQTHVFNESNS